MTDTPELPVELPPETPPAKRNVLGTRQIVALWAWCERNRDSLPVLPNPKLAAIAQAELDFPVTPANIANMLEEMHIEKRRPDAPVPMDEQVSGLQQRLAQREDEIARLADAWRKMEDRQGKLLQDLLLLSNRLERVEQRSLNGAETAADPAQPDIPGLPRPEFTTGAPPPALPAAVCASHE